MENAVGLLLFSGLTAVLVWREGDRRMRASLRWLHRRGIGLAWRWRRATRSRARFSFLPLAVLALIGVTVAVLGLGIRALSPEGGGGALGTLGDFFGGILNPVIAAAALLALLHTIRIQQEELRLTRAEMEKTSAALQGQQEATLRSEFRSRMSTSLSDLLNAQNALEKVIPGEFFERLEFITESGLNSSTPQDLAEYRDHCDMAHKMIHHKYEAKHFILAASSAAATALSHPELADEASKRMLLTLREGGLKICWTYACAGRDEDFTRSMLRVGLPSQIRLSPHHGLDGADYLGLPDDDPAFTSSPPSDDMLKVDAQMVLEAIHASLSLHPAAPSSPLSRSASNPSVLGSNS